MYFSNIYGKYPCYSFQKIICIILDINCYTHFIILFTFIIMLFIWEQDSGENFVPRNWKWQMEKASHENYIIRT